MMRIKQDENLPVSNSFTQLAIYSLGVCFWLGGLLIPQNVTAKEKESAENQVDKKLVVTGSRIRKIDINNLSPILSISREDIDKQGYATVKDVIDGLSQNSGGTMDNSFTFGFTPGASSVNLRGIGFGHTLVLVDGRRLPIYPLGIGGTSNFVDLSAIPMAFVERIDVLTDGASAVYGSDAVSGVINVITRKDIEGISMNYRYGDTSDGGYENHRYNLMTGARNGDTQIDFIMDIWTQKPLWANQRDYAASDTANDRGIPSGGGASFLGFQSGNVIQHPDCGTTDDPLGGLGIPDVQVSYFGPGEVWCGFDRSPYRQLIAPQDRISMMTRLAYEINPELSFFSRIGYSNSRTKLQMEPNFYGGSLFNGEGSAIENYGGILFPGDSNNPTTGTSFEEAGVFVRRLVEFGPRKSDIENNSINLLLGLEGSFAEGKYDWEFGVSYNRTNLDRDSNNILLSGLHTAVDRGLDLFQPIPQEVVNSLAYNANSDSNSSNRIVDFSLSGDLPFGFEAGPVRFALAIEKVSETYEDVPDPLVQQGDAFDGITSGKGKREHFGIGGEMSFPFADNFEMDIALRWDDYDDASSVNSAVSPRLALGYRPFESLLTRFSFGKSFRAPDMQRLFGGETRSFVDILDPEFLVDENGNLCPDNANQNCTPAVIQSVNLLIASNIDLAEEEGSNLSLGAVWEVTEEFNVSLDYFEIKLDEVVTTLSPQTLVEFCSAYDLFCDSVVRDSSGSLSGNSAFVRTQAINFSEWDTNGIDLVLNYEWQNSAGLWSSTLSVTRVNDFETRFTQEFESVENVSLGQLPEYRANLVFDWQIENWGVTAKLNYIDRMAGAFCFPCARSEYIDSWLTSNVSMRYSFSEFTRFRFGINNLTNQKPPQDPTQTNWPWFSQGASYHNAIGREIYFQIDASF